MATTDYHDVRRIVHALSESEQQHVNAGEQDASILELQGLGKDIWQGIDAQEYVDRERASWNGGL
jgi:hypothetical protein